MPEGSEGTTEPEGSSGQQPPESGQGQQPPESGQGGTEDSSRDPRIARLNAEAKSWREQFEAEKAKNAEYERSKLSESERMQADLKARDERIAALEASNRDLRLEGLVVAAATKAKAVDPGLIFRTLDRSKVSFDEAGQPTNLSELISDLRKEYPMLFGAAGGGADGGARPGGGTQTTDMTELMRRGAGRRSA